MEFIENKIKIKKPNQQHLITITDIIIKIYLQIKYIRIQNILSSLLSSPIGKTGKS